MTVETVRPTRGDGDAAPGRMIGRVRSARGMVGVLIFLAVWEFVSRVGLLSEQYFPPASRTIVRLVQLLAETGTWVSLGQTVLSWALGLCIGIALAVPAGFLLGASTTLYRFFRVPIELTKPIPPVVFIPPAVLILGTGQPLKVVLVSYAAFWPILMQSISGIENVDPVAKATLRSFHIGMRDRLRFLTIPSSWPYVVAGLRIAASLALIATVVTELVANAKGLGQSIAMAQISGLATDMYALIVIAGALGLLVNHGFERLEEATLAWNRRAES